MCVILGAVIEILDLRYPVELTKFFGVDPLQAEELEEGNGMYHLMLLYINELFFLVYLVLVYRQTSILLYTA